MFSVQLSRIFPSSLLIAITGLLRPCGGFNVPFPFLPSGTGSWGQCLCQGHFSSTSSSWQQGFIEAQVSASTVQLWSQATNVRISQQTLIVDHFLPFWGSSSDLHIHHIAVLGQWASVSARLFKLWTSYWLQPLCCTSLLHVFVVTKIWS